MLVHGACSSGGIVADAGAALAGLGLRLKLLLALGLSEHLSLELLGLLNLERLRVVCNQRLDMMMCEKRVFLCTC